MFPRLMFIPNALMLALSVVAPLLSAIPLSHHVTKYIWAVITFTKDSSLLCTGALNCFESFYIKRKKHRTSVCISQWAFTCSKLTIEALEQGVKYVQVFLLLTLNM